MLGKGLESLIPSPHSEPEPESFREISEKKEGDGVSNIPVQNSEEAKSGVVNSVPPTPASSDPVIISTEEIGENSVSDTQGSVKEVATPNEVSMESNPILEPKPAPVLATENLASSNSIPETPSRHEYAPEQRGQAVFQIEVEKIAPNPHQPRKEFDDASLRELAQSIREFGILQPLIVTKIEHDTPTGVAVSYELIAGERRLMASKLLGLPRVPAIVRTGDTDRDRLEMAVIENIQRENLNPVETARAFARLQDEFRMTQREIASRLGKSREVVANTLRLLDSPTYIQDAVSKGTISESHARLLLAVTDPDAQEKLFQDLVDRHLTTRELRMRISARKPIVPQSAAPSMSPELLALEEKISAELGTPVKIAQTDAGGRITIMFYSPEELRGILNRLGTKEDI
ncbi:MAG: ParB/RepB/Spo0J family partition protein [Patescibacteria group bacterium]|nr:ParB/RepB/Spo0J family partition protein [Patescibacteria group bacterium]